MYVEFLWDRFIKVHHATFGNLCMPSEQKFSFYTWENEKYRKFMLDVLVALEPRIQRANSVIFDELQDINEVIFFEQGIHKIGYEFNGTRKFPLVYKNVACIGNYSITFNKKSSYIYATVTDCKGYFIRRRNWFPLFDNHLEVGHEFKRHIVQEYEKKIKRKVNMCRIIDLNKVKRRGNITGTGEPVKFVMNMDANG
jgi:hypothetical protein